MKDATEYCVIDCRVSDPSQLEGGSLDDQEIIGRLEAQKLGLKISKVFKKPHSATTSERDDIEEILSYIKGERAKGVNLTKYIAKSIDRMTRMGYPAFLDFKNELEHIGVAIVDAQGIIQPKRNTLGHFPGNFEYKWSVHSPSEAGEMLEAYKGKAEVRDILTRMVGAEIKLVQDGYAVRRAPDGLKNKRVMVDGKKKVIREANPERVDYFIKMFELLADGADYPEVADRLNAVGFKTQVYDRWDRSDKENPKVVGKKGGSPLTAKQLQRYILQTEYAGVSYEKWTKHRPVKMQQFNGIVPIDTFNKANRGKIYIRMNKDETVEVLHNYSPWGRVKRLKDNPKYPWKCILCPSCQSEMLGSSAKGKYDGYHCGAWKSGKRAHKHFRVTKKDFEDSVCAYLDNLKFEEGFMAGLELHLVEEYRKKEKEILIDSSLISRTVSDLKAELAQKIHAFGLAESPTMRRHLEAQAEALETQIEKAEGERGRVELNERSIRGFRRYVEYVMEHPAEILTKADNLQARRALMSLFFEEMPTYHDILNGTAKLTSLFRLSEAFKVDKTQLVSPPE
jgi:hypothetical protein